MIRAILTDIEGTTSSLAFVADTLFPYARARLRTFLAVNPDAAGGIPIETLERWIDEDRKEPVLKAVQGRIWREGYEQGELKGHVYDDAVAALGRWRDAGLMLFVYSSGSVEAQKLLFRYSEAGDLSSLFDDYFDLGIGSKLEAGSYTRIAERTGIQAPDILFLSDNARETEASAAAGMSVHLIDRAAGDTLDEVLA